MPEQITVELTGITLALRVWPADGPSRPPVVLLPATAETAEDWDVVAAALSHTRTAYAVDLRGHGLSDWPGSYSIQLLADDVVTLLAAGLADPPVDLVGHSLGGLVACAVAAARPTLVRRLVLEDVGLLRPRPDAPPSRPEGILRFDWRMVEQVRPEIDNFDPRWADVVAAISASTLVVSGGPSSPVSQDQIADLIHLLPDGRTITIDAGHLVHASKPEEFANALMAFLDERPALA